MAKRKSKAEVVEQVEVSKGLKELVAEADRSKPFTFNKNDHDAKVISEVTFELKSSTSKFEYHANGDITVHWK